MQDRVPSPVQPADGHEPPEPSARGAAVMIGRAFRLRCPVCGRGRMFDRWTHMRGRCDSCGLILERGEQDYFIGAYLLNLIIAELVVVAAMLVVLFLTWPAVPWGWMLWGIVGLTIPAAWVTYPFSRSLWLAVDLVFRPPEEEDFAPEVEVIDLEEARRRRRGK